MKSILKRLGRGKGERGSAFIMVLIFLLIGGVIIGPFLSFINTGLLTGVVYSAKTKSLYAADSGIESGIWEIRYDEMQAFPGYDPLAYYDYDSSYEWTQTIAEPINNTSVDVTIRNVWIPSNISVPSPAQAANAAASEKLRINGTRNATNDSYRINIIFTPENPVEKEDLRIDSIGIYLPPDYHYIPGSSNLESDPLALWYSVPTVQSYGSNEVIIWSGFGSLKFEELPPPGSSETATISFDYTADTDENLKAVSWVKTSGVIDIPFAWDDNHRFYYVKSTNGSDLVESYVLMPGIDDISIYGGALVAGGNIDLGKDSVVNGDILYEGTFNYQEPFTHNDGVLINMEIDLPTLEENEQYALDVKNAAISYDTYTGDYYIPIGNGVDITDLGPIYINGDLSIAKDNIINFTGPIYVEGNIDMDKDAEFTGGGQIVAVGDVYLAKTTDFGSSEDCLIMSLTGSIVFKKEGTIRSFIYAPYGNVQFDKSAEVTGSIIAGGTIQSDKEGTFTQNYDYYNGITIPGYTTEEIRPLTWNLD